MRYSSRVMSPRPLLLALAFVLVPLLPARGADGRFSQLLVASESAESGINRLSSDQVAVLDALVRRDLAAQLNPRRNDPPPPARFSQRLTDDERRNAGFATLTAPELERLDALVGRHATATLARTLLAPPVFVPAGIRLRPTELRTAPEIHGSFSLSYGVGKGFSERTGAMTLNYEDPVRGFSIMVGYSETHGKGRLPLYRDGYGDPLRDPFPYAP